MIDNTIIHLYHGGQKTDVETAAVSGFNSRRSVYCSMNRSLAEEASRAYQFFPAILNIIVPAQLYALALDSGLWEERPYMGCIQIEHCREVVVHPGAGVHVLNRCLLNGRHFNLSLSADDLVHSCRAYFPQPIILNRNNSDEVHTYENIGYPCE
ncbi:TPA: hypothetical protein HA241_04115 [Candidatus Woesearchaeota archaeon]|nr:hypothetical protein [Candidatus Woesearchaeota archaeon]